MATDHVIRAMTDDGSFRVLTVRTTDTVRAVVEAQGVTGVSARALGELVTAAVLVRETMAPGNRVQALYTDRFGSRLVGDAYPEGNTRGLAQVTDEVLGVQVGDGGLLQVERIVRAGRAHQGVVRTSDGDDMAGTLREYFQQSEQVTSMVDLACVAEDGTIEAAGGYVVQLLPELTEPPLAAMRERLAAFGDLATKLESEDRDPSRVLARLLQDVEYTTLGDSPVRFHCPCDPSRAVHAASTLEPAEIEELLANGENLTITCDYCRTVYTVGPAEYREILGE